MLIYLRRRGRAEIPARKGGGFVEPEIPSYPAGFMENDMKAVTMYRPSIQNALSDFDRCLDSFFGESHPLGSILAPAAKIFNHLPAVDIRETDGAYVLDMELPGFDEKNIEVHVDGTNLCVSSKQEDEKKVEGEKGEYLLRERRLNSFNRSFKLPENADPEAVSAAFKNGVLSMEIKKRPEAQKRTIQINAA